MNAPVTCALCAHCVIYLGSGAYSEVTPGDAGSVECMKSHDNEIDAAWGSQNLVGLAKLARKCPGDRMNAPVQKHHRELAFTCVWSDKPRPHELRWIEEGGGIGVGDERMRRVAQALANVEARMAHRAWDEGYRAGATDWGQGGPDNDVPTPNPYPELMP